MAGGDARAPARLQHKERPTAMRMNLRLPWAAALAAGWAAAGVYLDPARDAIVTVDYPPHAPCTLERLAAVDRAFGWGRVSYDAASQTGTVSGNLILGANDGTETVLRIGAADRPAETLIMRGNLYVHPYFVRDENPGKYWQANRRLNALVLGDPTNAAIRASLLFACTPSNRWTLFCGCLPWKPRDAGWGGGLYVYHGRIAPLDPSPGHEIGDGTEGVYLMGSTVLDHAHISGVKGMLYRMGPGINKDYAIRDTVFERVETPLACGAQVMTGCTFLDCGTAVLDRGSLNADLTACRFRDNDRNWALTYTDKGLVLTDCAWDAPRKNDQLRARGKPDGTTNYPTVSIRRRVTVAVTDAAGQPVPDATVSFRAEQDGCDLMQHRTWRSGPDGRTPDRDQVGAMVLTERLLAATDTPDRPAVRTFTYTVAAELGQRRGAVSGVAPGMAAGHPVTIVLSSK